MTFGVNSPQKSLTRNACGQDSGIVADTPFEVDSNRYELGRSPDLRFTELELPSQGILASVAYLLQFSALTVAGPCRIFTGFPSTPSNSGYRLGCFKSQGSDRASRGYQAPSQEPQGEGEMKSLHQGSWPSWPALRDPPSTRMNSVCSTEQTVSPSNVRKIAYVIRYDKSFPKEMH